MKQVQFYPHNFFKNKKKGKKIQGALTHSTRKE